MRPKRSNIEMTVTTRAPCSVAPRRSIGSSSCVSRKGARWLTASVSSMPSALSFRCVGFTPALCTSTWSAGWRAASSRAPARIASNEARSATSVETSGLKLRSRDVVARGGEQPLVAPEEDDGRAEAREAERRRLAESATRAGDETHATAQRVVGRRCAGSVDGLGRPAAAAGGSPALPSRRKLTLLVRRPSEEVSGFALPSARGRAPGRHGAARRRCGAASDAAGRRARSAQDDRGDVGTSAPCIWRCCAARG